MKKIKDEKEASERDSEYNLTKARHDLKIMKEEKENLEKKVEGIKSFDTEREKFNSTMLEENKAIKDELKILKSNAEFIRRNQDRQ